VAEHFEQFLNQQAASCLPFKSVNEEADMYMQKNMSADRKQSGGEVVDPLLALLSQDQGNAYEEIDPYTLEIISKILPNSGIEFLSRILQHAAVIQNILPNLEALGERVAVINTRTIRLLAKAIQWGYDTTHKYVSVLMSLGLLYRHKHTVGNMLVFPLKAYKLPDDLHALDNLIMQSRPKVRQFARKVKERLLLYNLMGRAEQQTEGVSGPSECDISLHHLLLVSMVEVIKSEGIEAEKGKHIALRLMQEVIGKINFPRQNITTQQKIRPESTSVGRIYASQQQILTNNNNTDKQYQTQLPFQAKEKNNSLKISVNRKRERAEKAEVSHSMEEESTHKGDFPQGLPTNTSQGRPEKAEVSHSMEEESPLWVDSSQGSLTNTTQERPVQTKVSYAVEDKSTCETEKNISAQPQHLVNQETDTIHYLHGNDIHYLHGKEVENIIDVLDFYYHMLKSEEINWDQIALPKDFFQALYAQLSAHYQRVYNNGVITRMKAYMWISIEVSIIKKIATHYEVNNENACIYIFNLSEREYKPDPEIKRNCYKPITVPYSPPVEEDPIAKKEAEYQFLRDRSKAARAEQEKYQDKVDSSTSADYEVDPYSEKSTPAASARKTFKKTHIANTEQESPLLQAQEDSQINESSSRGDSQSYDEYPAETQLEAAIRRRKSEEFLAMCEPEIKPLRIPDEVDPKDYEDAFYYVLRNRNINILFNNIYKNDTLRINAAQFLTTVFDNDNDDKNINVNKQNKNLLDKYKPEVIMRGFIDTILTMHEPGHASLQNPGAFFTSRCKFFQLNKPDLETDELINRFANMSYFSFAKEMHTLINSGQKIRNKQYKKRF
jgi:hypothetical protein